MRSQRIAISMLGTVLAGSYCAAQTQNLDAEAQARAIQQNAITDRYLTPVQVEMAGRIDTRNAIAGQEVSARLMQPATLADGTPLPKGTRLVGRVIQTRAGGPEQGSAVLVLTFDRAEVTAGKSIPVRCVIRTVAQSTAATMNRSTVGAPSTISDLAQTRRGGVAGGMPGTVPTIGGAGTRPGQTSPTGGLPSSAGGQDSGGGVGLPSATGSGPSVNSRNTDLLALQAAATPAANMKVAEAGESVREAPRSTGLPGVLLWTAPTASGALTATGRDISLEGGTQMTLGVIAR